METVWDALIVGGGPAGLAAGAYLARAGRRVVLLEAEALGGQARRLGLVENYPGFPRGVCGEKLMGRFVAQAKRWGVELRKGRATRTSRQGRLFLTRVGSLNYRSRALLLCSGAAFKPLGLQGEARLAGRGLYYGAFEQAPRFSGQTVVVAGGGEAAIHQALLLSRSARRVVLAARAMRLKAIGLLLRRLGQRRNVEMALGTAVERAWPGADGELRRVRLRRLSDGQRKDVAASALFALVGKEPRHGLARWARSPAGLFVAGDARPGAWRQIAIAAADGLRAAMDCEKHLQGL